MKFSSLETLEVVKVTTLGAVSDENLIKMRASEFQYAVEGPHRKNQFPSLLIVCCQKQGPHTHQARNEPSMLVSPTARRQQWWTSTNHPYHTYELIPEHVGAMWPMSGFNWDMGYCWRLGHKGNWVETAFDLEPAT